jgi:hypothetical protein
MRSARDLSEITTIAILKISPAHAHDGWLLRVVLKDEAGPATFLSATIR